MVRYAWVIKLVEKIRELFADAQDNIRIRVSDTDIALPVDLQYRRKEAFVLFSGTVTTNGWTYDLDVSNFSAMEVRLRVTSVSGTSPTLTVILMGKFDTSTDYKPLVIWENINTTGVWYATINPLIFKTIRVEWYVSGTSPSFNFRVDAVVMV